MFKNSKVLTYVPLAFIKISLKTRHDSPNADFLRICIRALRYDLLNQELY